jgi:hypothetical protein
MAQPVYSDHPLEEYLRRPSSLLLYPVQRPEALIVISSVESGEGVESMPGSTAEFIPPEIEVEIIEDDEPVLGFLPPAIRTILEVRRTSC